MTAEQFCYWLQGRAELVKNPPSDLEWKIIQDHLQLVFTKVTPTYDGQRVIPGTIQTWPPTAVLC